MKVRPIRLFKELNITEKDGKYAFEKVGQYTVPAMLNHRAILEGTKRGIFEEGEVFKSIDYMTEDKAYKLMYIACEGAKKGFMDEMDIDTFISNLDYDLEEIIYTAESLSLDTVPDTREEFIASLAKATADEEDKKK